MPMNLEGKSCYDNRKKKSQKKKKKGVEDE